MLPNRPSEVHEFIYKEKDKSTQKILELDSEKQQCLDRKREINDERARLFARVRELDKNSIVLEWRCDSNQAQQEIEQRKIENFDIASKLAAKAESYQLASLVAHEKSRKTWVKAHQAMDRCKPQPSSSSSEGVVRMCGARPMTPPRRASSPSPMKVPPRSCTTGRDFLKRSRSRSRKAQSHHGRREKVPRRRSRSRNRSRSRSRKAQTHHGPRERATRKRTTVREVTERSAERSCTTIREATKYSERSSVSIKRIVTSTTLTRSYRNHLRQPKERKHRKLSVEEKEPIEKMKEQEEEVRPRSSLENLIRGARIKLQSRERQPRRTAEIKRGGRKFRECSLDLKPASQCRSEAPPAPIRVYDPDPKEIVVRGTAAACVGESLRWCGKAGTDAHEFGRAKA